ncbi:MAG: hypothetical protein ACJ74W_22050 [Pyrinomonadaceae bacterium]
MPCKHVAKLAKDYVGLYCLYCGDKIADIGNDEGQVVLRRSGRSPKYVAIIHRGRQKVVMEAEEQSDSVAIKFRDAEVEVRNHELLLSFQQPEEVLIIEPRP